MAKPNELNDNFPALEDLRIDQDYHSASGVTKRIVNVALRKGLPHEFFRVHPGENYRMLCATLEFKGEREHYLVGREMLGAFPELIIPKMLFAAINRQGTPFIIPVRPPREDGRIDSWNQSLMEGVMGATKVWTRMASNMSAGAYDVYEATGQIPEPQWPEISFHELLKIAFKGRMINDIDHPAIKRLSGEI